MRSSTICPTMTGATGNPNQRDYCCWSTSGLSRSSISVRSLSTSRMVDLRLSVRGSATNGEVRPRRRARIWQAVRRAQPTLLEAVALVFHVEVAVGERSVGFDIGIRIFLDERRLLAGFGGERVLFDAPRQVRLLIEVQARLVEFD